MFTDFSAVNKSIDRFYLSLDSTNLLEHFFSRSSWKNQWRENLVQMEPQ